MSLSRLLTLLGLRRPPEQYGSAGWGLPDRDWLRWKGRVPAGGFFLGMFRGRAVVLPRMEAARHGVIVGGSGTGKSRGYYLPNAAWGGDSTLILTDPKSELWNLTSGRLETAVRFAPTEPERSEAFNWVPLCADARTSELCARVLVEAGNTKGTEQAWLDMETAFLSGVFSHAATLEKPTPLTAYRLFTRQPTEDLIEALLSSSSQAAREQGMVFSQTQERMRGSIVPVVAARLQFLRDESVARFTSAVVSPPDFSRLRRIPTAVYWCLAEHDIERLRPLTSLFFSLLLERIAANTELDATVPVLVLLDEFGNVGVIPGFETTIALARGRGVSLWLGLQSIAQLESRYGSAGARIILANCGTKVALSGLDVDSAEYVSRSLGEKTEEVGKVSRHGSLNASFSFSTAENARRLLTADEVRRIGSDEAIVLVGNRRPMLLTKLYFDEAPKAASQAGLGAAIAADVKPAQREEPPELPNFSIVEGGRKRGRRSRESR